MNDESLDALERSIGRLFVVGVSISCGLMLAGLTLWMMGNPRDLGGALLNAGFFVLVATPILRVIISFGDYVRERDWLFAAITLAVLSVLATSIVLAMKMRSRG